jgi:hypothetical protein
MLELREATAGQEIPLGYFLDSSDGDTETTPTISNTDIKIWKWGATTLADKNSGGGTQISGGLYYCTLDATDTNTPGPMVIFIHESGSLTLRIECAVLPANVWDSRFSTDKLQVDATQVEGADATDQIRDAVVDDATRIDASALNTLSSHDPGSTICADATPLTAAETESECNDALVALKLDHLAAVADADDPVNDSILAKMASSDGDWSGFSAATDSLEAIRDNQAGADAAAIADAVWNEVSTGHTDAGKAGAQLWTDIDDILDDTYELQTDDVPTLIAALPTAVENRSEMDSNSTQLANIVADTNELQTDDVPGLIAALNDPTAAAIADAVWDEGVAAHQGASTFGLQCGGDIDDIHAKLPSKAYLAGSADADGGIDSTEAGVINAEVLDVLNVDTYAEPGKEAPNPTATIAYMVNFMYKVCINKKTETASLWSLYDAAGSVVDQQADITDAAGTATFDEIVIGA